MRKDPLPRGLTRATFDRADAEAPQLFLRLTLENNVSVNLPHQPGGPKLPANFKPHMLSFDVYGTLMNTPPANLQAFRTILADAGQLDLDPIEFYSFWERRNVLHYREPYRTYKDICRLSLLEAYERFGVTAGRGEAIERYFECFS